RRRPLSLRSDARKARACRAGAPDRRRGARGIQGIGRAPPRDHPPSRRAAARFVARAGARRRRSRLLSVESGEEVCPLSTEGESRRVHTVAVGASAGGIEALRELVGALPAEFPGVVLVVLHVAPIATSVLPQILSRSGELEARHAEDGAVME